MTELCKKCVGMNFTESRLKYSPDSRVQSPNFKLTKIPFSFKKIDFKTRISYTYLVPSSAQKVKYCWLPQDLRTIITKFQFRFIMIDGSFLPNFWNISNGWFTEVFSPLCPPVDFFLYEGQWPIFRPNKRLVSYVLFFATQQKLWLSFK